MNGPWAAHSWRLALTLQQLRRELRQFAADLAAVSWCRLRRAHLLEADPHGGDHTMCTACAWCTDCRERRPDALLEEPQEVVLP